MQKKNFEHLLETTLSLFVFRFSLAELYNFSIRFSLYKDFALSDFEVLTDNNISVIMLVQFHG